MPHFKNLTLKKIWNEKLPDVHVVKWSFFVFSNQKHKQINKNRRYLANGISFEITFDENLAICLSLRFRLSITIGLS